MLLQTSFVYSRLQNSDESVRRIYDGIPLDLELCINSLSGDIIFIGSLASSVKEEDFSVSYVFVVFCICIVFFSLLNVDK